MLFSAWEEWDVVRVSGDARAERGATLLTIYLRRSETAVLAGRVLHVSVCQRLLDAIDLGSSDPLDFGSNNVDRTICISNW